MAALSDGYVVTWTSFESNGGDVFAQLLDSSGQKIGSEFRVNTETTDVQDQSEVVVLSDGGFMVAWESDGDQDGSGNGVYGQRFDSSANAVGGEFQINSYVTDDQEN